MVAPMKHALAPVLALAVLACTRDPATVDEDRPMSELSLAETVQLCEELAGQLGVYQATIKLACTAGAIGASDDLAECQSLASACIENPPEGVELCAEVRAGGAVSSCPSTITVAELRDCVTALAAPLLAVQPTLSCSSDVTAIYAELDRVPEECAPLDPACVELFRGR